MVLPALREKKLAKNEVENDKKPLCFLAKSERKRKVWKRLLKNVWISQRTVFKSLKHDVRLIEKQVRSIEPGRGSLNFLNRISIDRKSD